MRALLIDDERLARVELRRLLLAHPHIQIADEAGSAEEARSLIDSLQPELLFLDVEMPGTTGFDMLDELTAESSDLPAVIFTTAFERYAVRAFEVRAVDYLLKPIQPHRLAEALERLRQTGPSERPSLPLQQLFVRSGERAWIVRTADIRLIEAEGNYARLHFGTESPLILRSLQTLHDRLDSNFFRANRSQIVNLRAIAKMDLAVDGAVCATLKDGTFVTFSRRQSQLLREQMTP